MGSFKLGKMTLRSLFSKPATIQYPYEKREYYPAVRGHVENDMDVCILCGICGRSCPVGAIEVDRKGGTWSIDPYMCVQCSHCVRECPKKCLSMSTEMPPATVELTKTVLTKPVVEKPKAAAGATGAAAGAAGAAGDKPTAKPKPKLTPEQEARVAAARAAKEAKKKAAAEAAKAEQAEKAE